MSWLDTGSTTDYSPKVCFEYFCDESTKDLIVTSSLESEWNAESSN